LQVGRKKLPVGFGGIPLKPKPGLNGAPSLGR
jgi:hypothetical protein